MTQEKNVETLEAKTPEPDMEPAAPSKGRRWVVPVIWALSIVLALCVGTVVGGGVVYGVMRVRGNRWAGTRLPMVPQFRPGPRDIPEDLPRRGVVPGEILFGALVVEVTDGSPAERAGLESGDVIVAVDDQELGQERDLADLIARYEPGDAITLQVRELSGRLDVREVTVSLGEHPERPGAAYLGVTFVPLPGGGMWRNRGHPFGDFEFHFECEGEDCPEMERFFEQDDGSRFFRFLQPGGSS
jgi:membrane-associated protease RseP (regulator of RpoE activity)